VLWRWPEQVATHGRTPTTWRWCGSMGCTGQPWSATLAGGRSSATPGATVVAAATTATTIGGAEGRRPPRGVARGATGGGGHDYGPLEAVKAIAESQETVDLAVEWATTTLSRVVVAASGKAPTAVAALEAMSVMTGHTASRDARQNDRGRGEVGRREERARVRLIL
jgi:hypothetical protein